MSATSEMLSEIKEVNLSYLLLAQRLLREDKAVGMFRMGINDQLADVLANLSFAQTVKLAASNQLLCRFRFDDHAVLSSLADKGKAASLTGAHSAILMASQPVESVN
ncbi:flagellar transcriptional regulator FlhD [Trinickia sp.]|uniref:flagellar transcriptional regulator FlhD n=1 Tax=Trinickia sp. TaxID=2571163 RepID=UPI003F804EAC